MSQSARASLHGHISIVPNMPIVTHGPMRMLALGGLALAVLLGMPAALIANGIEPSLGD